MIDLHSHTTASDGQYAPHEQVAMAAKAGVTVLAVTDHDTVAGLSACAEAARLNGIRLINGIEISCTLNRREVHILGHFVDPTEPGLNAYAARLVTERTSRMQAMIDKLVAIGVPVTLQQVQQLAGDATLTRPHLARVLVELRICTSNKEAFDRFLGDGKPAWVQRFELTPREAIEIIHRAGGTATIAHPGSSKVHRGEIEDLAKAGLDGLEVIHKDHPPSQREQFAKWATELGLVATAGSDFHGEKVAPDRNFGSVGMDAAEFARLEARRPKSA
ncbi:MAG: PHP domain-containing protein [Archangium sp.]|nr:PHP domain-containing protein [Archangium sp.]